MAGQNEIRLSASFFETVMTTQILIGEMQINFTEKETDSDLERIGIDFSFLSLFWNLTVEKQHKILLAYIKVVQTVLHPDHNLDLSVPEKEKIAEIFNKLNELKDFSKFAKQLQIFKSDKSKFVSSINEISRERSHFAAQWKRTLKELTALQKERNELILEIRKLKGQTRENAKTDG